MRLYHELIHIALENNASTGTQEIEDKNHSYCEFKLKNTKTINFISYLEKNSQNKQFFIEIAINM